MRRALGRQRGGPGLWLLLLFRGSLSHFCFQGACVSLFTPSSMSRAEWSPKPMWFHIPGPLPATGLGSPGLAEHTRALHSFSSGPPLAVPGSGAAQVMRCGWLRCSASEAGRQVRSASQLLLTLPWTASEPHFKAFLV